MDGINAVHQAKDSQVKDQIIENDKKASHRYEQRRRIYRYYSYRKVAFWSYSKDDTKFYQYRPMAFDHRSIYIVDITTKPLIFCNFI